MTRIAFLSTHLSGSGHFVRTLMLARAALARGHEVRLFTGGKPLPHVDAADVPVVQLPPLSVAGLDFRRLLTQAGTVADAEYRAARARALCDGLRAFGPEVLVTETYPFGRRPLREEFEAAIGAAGDATLICSVRDVPEPKPHREGETAAILSSAFHGVVVHGDAGFLPLSASWTLPEAVADMVHHTGYVGRAAVDPATADEILVAVGGGTLGRPMLDLATEAASGSARRWRVRAGAEVARGASCGRNVVIEGLHPDYPARLAGAACSVSLCGYNTAVDLAQVDTPAILIPSEEGGEREQSIRAGRFGQEPGFHTHRISDLTPELLRRTAENLADGPRRPRLRIALDDGTGAVRKIEDIHAGRAR